MKILEGRFKGKEYKMEGEISKVEGHKTDLPTLWDRGNYAAKNAMEIDNYTVDDEPFYYGKIDGFGYIISHKDIYGIKK